jgi:hypothetical protein
MASRVTIKEHGVFLGGVLVLLLFIGIAAAGPTDDVIIGINISQTVSIDVSPNTVNWTGLNIGETGDPEYFTVTNVGSVNITSLRANITNDDSNPYGTGNPMNYNAGEFILFNQTDTGFYYVNKKNWNESIPGEVTSPDDFTEGNATGYFGIIRTAWDNDVGQQYYFFTNRTSDSGDCHSSSANILIGIEPKNITDQGSVDFSGSPGTEFLSFTVPAGDEGVDINSGDFTGYCALLSADCSTVTLTKWNTDLDTNSDCTSDTSFYTEGTHGKLQPGNYTWFWLEPKIPNGVPDGDVFQGTLTIIATG